MRTILSDFAVIISIVVFVLIDYSVSLPTPKLDVPAEFQVIDEICARDFIYPAMSVGRSVSDNSLFRHLQEVSICASS